VGLFYFMAIEKRYYDSEADYPHYLSFFHTCDNKIRIIIEDKSTGFFVELEGDELKELIQDLNFILKDINDSENELH